MAGPWRGYVAASSLGLGHAARAVAIAQEVARRRPDAYLFFLAGSPALDLAVSSGFDAMPLPPTPPWRHRSGEIVDMAGWYRDYGRYLRVARRFLRKEADWDTFRFLISDGELATVAEALGHGVPTVLLVPSIGQRFARDPLARGIEAIGNRWFASLARRADLVLALEPGVVGPNVRYVGPIVRPFSKPREQLREDFVFLKKTILVAPGGTDVGGFLLERAVRAFRALQREDAQLVVASGPALSVPREWGVVNYGFLPNLQDYVCAADLVITLAGKGIVFEALAAGTPVIAIPSKNHPEQETNVRLAGLDYRFEDANRLEELIPKLLAQGRWPPRASGLMAAVDAIETVLSKSKESRPRA